MPTISRPLSKDVLRVRVGDELARMAEDGGRDRLGRRARTLVKDGPLRVTLISLAEDGRIPAHRAEGPIIIELVSGEIVVEVNGESHALRVGELLALRAEVEHAVASSAGGAFLLTVVLA